MGEGGGGWGGEKRVGFVSIFERQRDKKGSALWMPILGLVERAAKGEPALFCVGGMLRHAHGPEASRFEHKRPGILA